MSRGDTWDPYAPTQSNWEQSVLVIQKMGGKVIPPAKHNFKKDSNCAKCNCYGPYEESLPCIEGATVQGTINEAGHWEPMISIPVSEYEELREKAFMYDELCK